MSLILPAPMAQGDFPAENQFLFVAEGEGNGICFLREEALSSPRVSMARSRDSAVASGQSPTRLGQSARTLSGAGRPRPVLPVLSRERGPGTPPRAGAGNVCFSKRN